MFAGIETQNQRAYEYICALITGFKYYRTLCSLAGMKVRPMLSQYCQYLANVRQRSFLPIHGKYCPPILKPIYFANTGLVLAIFTQGTIGRVFLANISQYCSPILRPLLSSNNEGTLVRQYWLCIDNAHPILRPILSANI